MSLPILVILIVVSSALLIGFAALMISAMTTKRKTGHHGQARKRGSHKHR